MFHTIKCCVRESNYIYVFLSKSHKHNKTYIYQVWYRDLMIFKFFPFGSCVAWGTGTKING